MNDIVKIKKINETNIKLICEIGILQEISDYFTFDVPGAKYMPSYRNKLWDGKIRLVNSLNGLLYAGLTSHVEEFCKSRKYDIEYENISGDTEFSLKEALDYISTINIKYEPRDYQINSFVHAVRKNRALFLSPTASGKSLMIYLITKYFNCNTLIIVPTTSLVHQMSSDFIDYGIDPNSIHKIMEGMSKDTDKPIIISTWQSIYKLPIQWFSKFNLVIGDEAHLFKANSLIEIMKKLPNCQHRYGFTGTLDGTQTNKMVLEGLFGPVKQVTSTSKLIEEKHLADFEIKSIVLNYPDEIKKIFSSIDYQTEIDYIVTNEKRNKFIKNLSLSLTGNTLILFQFVEKQGKPLYNLIKEQAKDRKVFFISGEVNADQRELVRKILTHESDVIIVASSGTTSTGVNIPSLSNIIFASPSKSRIRNLQSIGRGLRKTQTKTNATLYDIADDLSWKSKRNHTLLHFVERIRIYAEEQFTYKIYRVNLN
jgi:superfamily II DNA or RNA helicase